MVYFLNLCDCLHTSKRIFRLIFWRSTKQYLFRMSSISSAEMAHSRRTALILSQQTASLFLSANCPVISRNKIWRISVRCTTKYGSPRWSVSLPPVERPYCLSNFWRNEYFQSSNMLPHLGNGCQFHLSVLNVTGPKCINTSFRSNVPCAVVPAL